MAVTESDLSDIQFLGNWSSKLPSSASSFVSAIVLTPMNSPSDIPRTFSRNQTSVVHVGRTPVTDSAFPSDDRATFSNPVMSRNHAKITFADSGSAFVIDTNSHHGTWVGRTAEFKLAAESPFQLHDGDRLTFGKEVQRNGVLHMPLTVTVKLLQSASTPSSMSISSTSVSPASKVASPRPRNRFGLDTSSDDSDGSSDSDDPREASMGPNDIRVELPPHQPEHHVLHSGSPKSPKIIDVVHSDPSSPGSKKHLLTESRGFSPLQLPISPIDSPNFSSDLLPPAGIELQEISIPADPAHKGTSSLNASKSPTPPWRLNGSPWSNFSIIDRMAGLLQQPPRKIGLLNPLWMKASMAAGSEERAGRSTSSNRLKGSGDALDVFHGSHGSGHNSNYGQLNHGSGPNHSPDGLQPQWYERQGFRLDADWGLYGQHGNEVMVLNKRLQELKKDVDNMRTNREDNNQRLDLVFHRLDELEIQLKNNVAEGAKVSQHTPFAESTGLNALKDGITSLQNDISILKAHKCEIQSDITFLRANHEDVKMDLSSLKDISERHTSDTATLTENARSLRHDTRELREEFEALRNQSPRIQHDLTTLTESLSGVHNNIDTLLSDMQSTNMSIVKIDGEIRDLSMAHTRAEQDLASRVREQVRSEVMALIDQGGELSPMTGKRKRGEEDPLDTSIGGCTPVTSISRPRKRLRVVADCAAAGAVGALGAWFGLAFL
ncbi:hypothetical protein JB92DRAFT_2910315 [Gautieria morchelliformis]|nr:hypothetical protein JB92DRAFT_2910315 [Gautieria morchelliformis]